MLSIQELQSSTQKELLIELKSARKALQEIRIGVLTKNQKDTSLVCKQKLYIARILTLLKEMDLETMVEKAATLDS